MDADHLDIYKKRVNVEESFLEFADLITDKKKLIIEENLKDYFGQSLTYGFSSDSDLQIINLHMKSNSYYFDFKYKGNIHEGFTFKLPGKHNLLNAAGAVLSCLINGISFSEVRDGLASFSGVKRRFEIHIESPKYVFIDDYAHHPKEIEVLINAVREFYPDRKVKGVFQPHLFSRTRDFMQEFADSLSMLDELFLLPIYPAREKPIDGVSASVLYEKINLDKKFLSKGGEDYFSKLYSSIPCVIVTIGAGDINLHVDKINNLLHQDA
jgi:UDP-N-acetylmuramate--alanine ligase